MQLAARTAAWARLRYTAKDYVQDGLIAMWDGIENAGWGVHDPNATVWKDLSGNGYDAVKSGDVNWADDHADFTPSTRGMFDTNSFLGKPQQFTFEVVIKRIGTRIGPMSPFSCVEAGGCGFQYENNGSRISTACGASSGYYGNVFDNYLGTEKKTYSFVFSNTQILYRDSIEIGSVAGGSVVRYNNSFHFLIGCEAGELQWNPSSFNGYVYAVRAYSRPLTPADIAANYAIDKARFNLA